MEVENRLVPAIPEEDDPVLGEIQLLTAISLRTGVPLQRLGRVEWFNASRGWGLIRVPGRDRALFVNSSDILVDDRASTGARFRFVQLIPGEVVSFELNESAPRGPRAERVKRIPSGLA